jgi:flavin reductase (DIM6/NTAB) family NADH-FMN oxidoreductase RutF
MAQSTEAQAARPDADEIDSALFREIWSRFPAGVTVVTAIDSDNLPRGLTCTAVCPVAAAPPLLLVVVGGESNTLPAIQHSGRFVVNFLASSAKDTATLFASKESDKFRNIAWKPSIAAAGAPILKEAAAAYAECVIESTIQAGDHWLFIARIVAGATTDKPALAYFRRQFLGWSDSDGFLLM